MYVYIYVYIYVKVKQSHYNKGKVEASCNVMAHAQEPDFVFRRNGRVHLNRPGESVQSTAGSRGVRISGSNAGVSPTHRPPLPPRKYSWGRKD